MLLHEALHERINKSHYLTINAYDQLPRKVALLAKLLLRKHVELKMNSTPICQNDEASDGVKDSSIDTKSVHFVLDQSSEWSGANRVIE